MLTFAMKKTHKILLVSLRPFFPYSEERSRCFDLDKVFEEKKLQRLNACFSV
jgi:hypothetical protein